MPSLGNFRRTWKLGKGVQRGYTLSEEMAHRIHHMFDEYEEQDRKKWEKKTEQDDKAKK